jgi:uncharacterized protein YbjT (DUF2867 family)
MEDVLRASDLDWTVVRPPRLTNKPLTSKPLTSKPLTSKPLTSKPLTSKPLTSKPLTSTYRMAYDQNVRRGLSISRADVAHVMLRVLAEPGTFRRTVSAAR